MTCNLSHPMSLRHQAGIYVCHDTFKCVTWLIIRMNWLKMSFTYMKWPYIKWKVGREFQKVRMLAGRNEICYTYKWVMSHIRMSHVTHAHESFRTYEGVVLHKWDILHSVCDGAAHCIRDTWQYLFMDLFHLRWIMSSKKCERLQVGVSHFTRMNESCHTYEQVLARMRMSHFV